MNQEVAGYEKFKDFMKIEDFIQFFSTTQNLSNWFTDKELSDFPFPKAARSLAGRYLIKKRIAVYLDKQNIAIEMQIPNNELGKPELKLGDGLSKLISEFKIKKIICSISHSREWAASLTIICL